MQALKKTFREQGVVLLPKLCSQEQITELGQGILAKINQCADELNCRLKDYLCSVSRWVDPSSVTQPIASWAKAFFSPPLNAVMGQEVKLSKINIISKTAYARHRVPCHQDITYSRTQPYEFSLWLALNDVTLEDGVLEFLPTSHLGEIVPAIDFWQPEFVDQMRLSTIWQENAISLPVQAGDAILFDSRIWHGSANAISKRNRFALVTRWSCIDYQPPEHIPEKKPAYFGMWTCGSLTESLLQKGLAQCFQYEIAADLATYITIWNDKLSQQATLPFSINVRQAQKALNHLLILHQAAQKQNGGDAQGIVYPQIWLDLLKPLSTWLNKTSHVKEDNHESTI